MLLFKPWLFLAKSPLNRNVYNIFYTIYTKKNKNKKNIFSPYGTEFPISGGSRVRSAQRFLMIIYYFLPSLCFITFIPHPIPSILCSIPSPSLLPLPYSLLPPSHPISSSFPASTFISVLLSFFRPVSSLTPSMRAFITIITIITIIITIIIIIIIIGHVPMSCTELHDNRVEWKVGR